MDVKLDCHFDSVFFKLDRSDLIVLHERQQLVDYLNTVINECVAGQDCDKDTVSREAVMAALRYHDSSKHANDFIGFLEKKVLYITAKLCYDWNIKDSSVIKQLLDKIFQWDHNFGSLFFGAIYENCFVVRLTGWESLFKDKKEYIAAFEYFLNHATKAKLEYNHRNVGSNTRFIDIPVEVFHKAPIQLAVDVSNEAVLLLLLRYGANVKIIYKRDEGTVEPPIMCLNELCNTDVPLNVTTGPIACLKIFLRAVPTMVAIQYSNLNGKIYVLVDRVLDKVYYHPRIIKEGIIPPSRRGSTPPELKHLCRCTIRNTLRENWQLPEGIKKLNIPISIQNYLDLLAD